MSRKILKKTCLLWIAQTMLLGPVVAAEPLSQTANKHTLSSPVKISASAFKQMFSSAQDNHTKTLPEKIFRVNRELKAPKIAASVLDVTAGNLKPAAQEAWRAGLDLFHIDHMDGEFVSAQAEGLFMMQAINEVEYGTIFSFSDQEKARKRPLFDVHLMAANVDEYLVRQFIDMGTHTLTFHYEAALSAGKTPETVIAMIRSIAAAKGRAIKVGISIKPSTPAEKLYPLLDKIDQVLIMTVEPGAGGQEFLPEMLDKIRNLRHHIDAKGYNVLINVDGGITRYYAQKVSEAGADIIVVGSTIFKQAILNQAGRQNATIKNAIESLRAATTSPAAPLNAEQQKKIVDHVISRIEHKLKQNSLPEKNAWAYRQLLRRYTGYQDELIHGKRIALPKYFYGVSESTGKKAGDDLITTFARQKLPFEFKGFGDDGVFFRDRIVTKKMVEESGQRAFFFKDYNVWISLPSDIELEGQVVYSQSEGPLGQLFRFTVNATSTFPDYGILLHFAKIGNIVIVDKETFLQCAATIRRLPLVRKYNIPVIGIEEAQLEAELLDNARKAYDRLQLIKEGKYEFDWISPRPIKEALLKEFNSLNTGDIVMVKSAGKDYYGYITAQNGHRFVTYLDSENALTGAMLNANAFTTKQIVMLTDQDDKFTYAGNENRVNFNTIARTNVSIDLEKLGNKNFLEYLVELDTLKKPAPQLPQLAPVVSSTESLINLLSSAI